jgi:hypothetical protein
VIAAVAGNADRTYNLTVNHERNDAFEGHGSGKTKNAEPGTAARNQILKSLAGALEPYGDVMT